jgi:hypothetical protein
MVRWAVIGLVYPSTIIDFTSHCGMNLTNQSTLITPQNEFIFSFIYFSVQKILISFFFFFRFQNTLSINTQSQ